MTSGPIGFAHDYVYQYEGRDGYLETQVNGTSSNPNFKASTSESRYDAWGRRVAVRENTPGQSAVEDRVRYFKGIEWWRVPPVTSPQTSIRNDRLRHNLLSYSADRKFMIVFPMRGAHAGDLILALPAIGAALAWGPVTVSGIGPRYYLPFRRLPVTFRYADSPGHLLRPDRVRGRHQTDLWLDALPRPAEPVRLPLPLLGTQTANVLLPGDGWVLLSPWSDFAPKRWTPEGWRAVAIVALELGYRVAVLGPPASADLCADIAGVECNNLVGKDTPETWPALLGRGSLVIGTDSAPIHVADALGVPVVGLYGRTMIEEFGPYWQRERCIGADRMGSIAASTVCDAVRHWHETRQLRAR